MPVRGIRETKYLSIGQLSARTGLAVSAIRYYESEKLVQPIRNSGGQRQFQRSDIRRLSFVMIAQQLGFPLKQIRVQLKQLPDGRILTQKDWAKISTSFSLHFSQRLLSVRF